MPGHELDRKSADYSNQAIGCAMWKLFLLLVWALWWGGLCFYAVVVVPIGTDVIGSMEQGLITQRVTQWHNGFSGLFLTCIAIEATRRRSKRLWMTAALLAIIDIALVLQHARVTAMIDFQQQVVSGRLYAHHAIYLWLAAAE